MSEERKRMLALIVVLVALALLAGLATAAVETLAFAATITVCPPPGTGCDHTTIQAAVDSASVGDTIRVAQGTYTENLSIALPITLTGGYSGPPDWTRDLTQYETFADGSGSQTVPGDWDGDSIAFPRVIFDGSQYWMLYNGQNLTYPGWGWTLGLAESLDGVSWSKYGDNPVLELGDEGQWDGRYRGQVAMMEEGGLFKMWYSGSDGGPWQTGYATSLNGVDWTIYEGNPVLTVGAGGSWDEQEADGPTVIRDGGLYKMWYHGCNADWTVCSIGYATSTDGEEWSKHDGNPVLTGTAGEWDEDNVLWPSVVKDGDEYLMWYFSFSGGIGLATSPDGVDWTKYAGNPVLEEGWDGAGARAHSVTMEGDSYKMWLRSGAGESAGIGYADSADGIVWTMYGGNPVLTPGTPSQWGEPVVRLEGGSEGSVLDGLTITGGDGEWAGGVDAEATGALTIRNCLIRNNRAQGRDGWGAGGVLGGSPLTIVDTWIMDNQVGQGASGVRPGAQVTMINVVLAGNSGDAAIHANGSASLTNVTVANHDDGGILFNPEMNATLAVLNSIVYSNAFTFSFGETCPPLGVCQITYSDVEGGWPEPGNIDADPTFMDPANSDYHLAVGSPCIDRGTAVGAPTADIEGTPRDAKPDMGAYEWTGFRIFLPLVVRNH